MFAKNGKWYQLNQQWLKQKKKTYTALQNYVGFWKLFYLLQKNKPLKMDSFVQVYFTHIT